MFRSLATVLLAATLAASPFVVRAADAPVTVFAAASLKESMDEAALAYGKATGTPVRVSYAASSTLARQIEQSAPAQAFASADLEWMDYLQQRNRIDAATRHDLLGNRLVLVAPQGSAVKVDLAKPGSIAGALGEGRLALGQTATVPAGKYARTALESLAQWEPVKARLAESESVRAALMLVARGETPLGVVYASDAKAEPRVRVVATFPAGSHPPIVYPVAALRDAPAPARDFVRWLSSPEARAIFERRGFDVLD
ncbi:molybdate ABC transporter substrate-binding protein [Pseudoxanthomonas daejeonensis]|uniref:Molybdate ABC transporter substrate-binding protein n=1 Tax=Pseudoxanthomonas daejeonensis TaxID=266062 RepID=A0ABQ6Z476_9GAMM|nr:molybdate ABC transporter substrate-binding protein [Pseudoxanthomonas daejeonensis]KAF1692591.1 molybdate ABC transporter substrate-binding protein [Pseudoxanthomonas daejeonensis]